MRRRLQGVRELDAFLRSKNQQLVHAYRQVPRPLVCAADLLNKRLRKAIFGEVEEPRSDMSCLHWHAPLEIWGRSKNFRMTMERPACLALKHFCHLYQLPLNHLFVALFGLTFWKATLEVASFHELCVPEQKKALAARRLGNLVQAENPLLKIPESLRAGVVGYTILVANRDGENQDSVVGNIVVDRNFEIKIQDSETTYIGLVLEVSRKIQNREWYPPSCRDPWQNTRIGMNMRPHVPSPCGGVTTMQDSIWSDVRPRTYHAKKCESLSCVSHLYSLVWPHSGLSRGAIVCFAGVFKR
jgi:hypothetical protein